jgi:hypothetical protein
MLLSCLGPVPCSFGGPVPLPSWLADGPAGQVVRFSATQGEFSATQGIAGKMQVS